MAHGIVLYACNYVAQCQLLLDEDDDDDPAVTYDNQSHGMLAFSNISSTIGL